MVGSMGDQTLAATPVTIFSNNLVAASHKRFIAIIILVWAVVYLGSIFHPPLLDDADTVHAEAAREMDTGRLGHPSYQQWLPVSRKSPADVLVHGDELQDL